MSSNQCGLPTFFSQFLVQWHIKWGVKRSLKAVHTWLAQEVKAGHLRVVVFAATIEDENGAAVEHLFRGIAHTLHLTCWFSSQKEDLCFFLELKSGSLGGNWLGPDHAIVCRPLIGFFWRDIMFFARCLNLLHWVGSSWTAKTRHVRRQLCWPLRFAPTFSPLLCLGNTMNYVWSTITFLSPITVHLKVSTHLLVTLCTVSEVLGQGCTRTIQERERCSNRRTVPG